MSDKPAGYEGGCPFWLQALIVAACVVGMILVLKTINWVTGVDR